jgi:hypothetical protein
VAALLGVTWSGECASSDQPCRSSRAVQAAKTEAGNCTAGGEGLSKAQAGIPATFQIKAVDCYGNRRNSGERMLHM